MKQTEQIIFDCVDGYTAGNPVRLVKSPSPELKGSNMGDKRLYFEKERGVCDMTSAQTVLKDNPLLTTRIKGLSKRSPARIILDKNRADV